MVSKSCFSLFLSAFILFGLLFVSSSSSSLSLSKESRVIKVYEQDKLDYYLYIATNQKHRKLVLIVFADSYNLDNDLEVVGYIHSSKLMILKIDALRFERMASPYDVKELPTYVFINNMVDAEHINIGVEVGDRIVGRPSLADLDKKLSEYIEKYLDSGHNQVTDE